MDQVLMYWVVSYKCGVAVRSQLYDHQSIHANSPWWVLFFFALDFDVLVFLMIHWTSLDSFCCLCLLWLVGYHSWSSRSFITHEQAKDQDLLFSSVLNRSLPNLKKVSSLTWIWCLDDWNRFLTFPRSCVSNLIGFGWMNQKLCHFYDWSFRCQHELQDNWLNRFLNGGWTEIWLNRILNGGWTEIRLNRILNGGWTEIRLNRILNDGWSDSCFWFNTRLPLRL